MHLNSFISPEFSTVHLLNISSDAQSVMVYIMQYLGEYLQPKRRQSDECLSHECSYAAALSFLTTVLILMMGVLMFSRY